MLVLVFFAVLEVFFQIYEYFNPRCDFMINPVSQDYDYVHKKQVCDSWVFRLIYIDPISGISQSIPNQHSSAININSYGFRGQEILMEKPEDTYRIFVVGGSTTFGIRSPDQKTIPGHLEQNLNKLNFDKKIEVINAGIGGITSTDELQLVTTKIVQFDPDLIIVFDGNNDIVNFAGKTKNKWSDDAITLTWKQYLSFYKTPFVVGGIIDDAKASISLSIFNPNFVEIAQVWKKNMITICELGKQQGFDTIVVLQPFLGTGNKTLSDFEKENLETRYVTFSTQSLYDGYQLLADELNNLENYCYKSSDFRNTFDDINESVYFDRVHVGPESNKILADKMADMVVPIIE
jgi:lysophospholipase L1-like esterase